MAKSEKIQIARHTYKKRHIAKQQTNGQRKKNTKNRHYNRQSDIEILRSLNITIHKNQHISKQAFLKVQVGFLANALH